MIYVICYITNVKTQKRCIADFLLYAIVFALGISHLHCMTTNIIFDIWLYNIVK